VVFGGQMTPKKGVLCIRFGVSLRPLKNIGPHIADFQKKVISVFNGFFAGIFCQKSRFFCFLGVWGTLFWPIFGVFPGFRVFGQNPKNRENCYF